MILAIYSSPSLFKFLWTLWGWVWIFSGTVELSEMLFKCDVPVTCTSNFAMLFQKKYDIIKLTYSLDITNIQRLMVKALLFLILQTKPRHNMHIPAPKMKLPGITEILIKNRTWSFDCKNSDQYSCLSSNILLSIGTYNIKPP